MSTSLDSERLLDLVSAVRMFVSGDSVHGMRVLQLCILIRLQRVSRLLIAVSKVSVLKSCDTEKVATERALRLITTTTPFVQRFSHGVTLEFMFKSAELSTELQNI